MTVVIAKIAIVNTKRRPQLSFSVVVPDVNLFRDMALERVHEST